MTAQHSRDANRYYRGVARQNELDMAATRHQRRTGDTVGTAHIRRGDTLTVYRGDSGYQLAWEDATTRVDTLDRPFSTERAARVEAERRYDMRAVRRPMFHTIGRA